MTIAIRSFAKINLGLKIGPARPDGFHELRTIYQTLALHDLVRVEAQPGSGIEIRCNDSRVPLDATNTCHKMAERVLAVLAEAGPPIARRTADPSAPLGSARDGNENRGAFNYTDSRRKVLIDIDKRLPVQGGLGAASSNGVATMLGIEQA